MTTKQNKAIEKMVANGGNISGEELLEIGYSPAIAHNPSKVIRSRAVKNELEKLLRKHGITKDTALAPIGEALQATKVVITGSKDDAFAEVMPDHAIRLKASDMALKLLPKDKEDKTPNPQPFDSELLKDLLASGNLVELQRVFLQKGTE